jgi:hypothetical protein
MTEKVFAYLDLLGFSENNRKDALSAIMALINFNEILLDKINDKEKVAEDEPGNINSFEYYLPFSDSLFITASNAGLFIKQLSRYCVEGFILYSGAYKAPEDHKDPTLVKNKLIKSHFDKKIKNEHWFPILFRGGISYGKVAFSSMVAIDGFKNAVINISGEPVVNAVKLENINELKGPRIFCDKTFYELLNENEKSLLYPTKIREVYEILWPTLIYNEKNDLKTEIIGFKELFIPALNLWKACNHLPYGIHYYYFMKLIIISTVNIYEKQGAKDFAIEHIKTTITAQGLDLKEDDLMCMEPY